MRGREKRTFGAHDRVTSSHDMQRRRLDRRLRVVLLRLRVGRDESRDEDGEFEGAMRPGDGGVAGTGGEYGLQRGTLEESGEDGGAGGSFYEMRGKVSARDGGGRGLGEGGKGTYERSR